MRFPTRRALGIMGMALLTLFLVAPAAAVGPTYPITALVPSGAAWTQLGGYPAISINYTNSQSSQFQGVVYVDIYNAAGQSVLVSTGSATFASGQKVDCFVPVIGLASGTFTARIFIVTPTNVPVSITSSLRFTS